MAYTVVAYTVTAYTVMAYIVMGFLFVMADIVMGYTVMAYIVMGFLFVMADIVMACELVGSYTVPRQRLSETFRREKKPPWPKVLEDQAVCCLLPKPVRLMTVALYRLYLGIADGMSIAQVWVCRHPKLPRRRGGHFEYRHAHTRAMDMASAMPR